MKKILLFSFIFFAKVSFANELHHYDEIKNAILTGKSIHIVIDFAKCSSSQKAAARVVHVGVFKPDEIQIANTHIAASLLHFTRENPRFPDASIFEFVRYTFNDDNNLDLTYQVLDADNYSPLTKKVSFNCKIDVGVKIYD